MRTYPGAAQTIRIQMVRCGYTLDRLSEDTGVSKEILRGILAGRTQSISVRTICAVSQVFGYSAAEFMDLISQAPTDP